jgi:hypothetical protein
MIAVLSTDYTVQILLAATWEVSETLHYILKSNKYI